MRQPLLREAMAQTLREMLRGSLPGFRLLQAPRCADLSAASRGRFPSDALRGELILSCPVTSIPLPRRDLSPSPSAELLLLISLLRRNLTLPDLVRGTSLEPLAELHVDTSAKAISVPDALWEQQRLRQCLHDVANSSVNRFPFPVMETPAQRYSVWS
ncbi:MAG: hypothetical protein SGPRY_006484 [Prymnesium sp.]